MNQRARTSVVLVIEIRTADLSRALGEVCARLDQGGATILRAEAREHDGTLLDECASYYR